MGFLVETQKELQKGLKLEKVSLQEILRPFQFNASFPVAPPTHFFGKVKKKNSRIACKEASTLIQAHDLVLLTPIVLNYHRYFVFVAFLDI